MLWGLGSLVLPTVFLLVPGVSAGEGLVASGLGVGGGAGVGVVVPGPGFGRGWLGVAGCGHPWLRAWWVHLCVLAVFLAALQPSGRGVAGFLFFGFACVAFVVRAVLALWCVVCVSRARFGGGCGGVCCVHALACVRCVGGAFGCLSSPFWAWFGGSVWVLGLCVVAPLPSRLCGSPPPLAGVCWWCVPPPPPLRALLPLSLFRVAWGGVPLVPCRGLPGCGGWGGVLVVGSGPFPWCFPLGGAMLALPVRVLYGPSICTRSVQMDLLRSQVLQPFPTPGSGTLWVAGESLRDRRVSCLPRWTVCPTRSRSLGPNRSTWRGECSWSGPLVTPPGRSHRRLLTNGPGRIPPYCVCSGGADTVTGGGSKPLKLGPSPVAPVGPFRAASDFAVWFAVVGFLSLPGGVVVVGGVFRFSWPCCLCACPHLTWLWFAVGVCVCGAVRARVVFVLVCVSCGRGGVGVGVPSVCVGVCVCVCGCVVGAGWGLLLVWVWVWSVCAVVGPSLAGVRWRWWCVVCGVWFVVCGVRRWCVGGVVAGVWCGWSLATPGGGSCVLLPATPGWV